MNTQNTNKTDAETMGALYLKPGTVLRVTKGSRGICACGISKNERITVTTCQTRRDGGWQLEVVFEHRCHKHELIVPSSVKGRCLKPAVGRVDWPMHTGDPTVNIRVRREG